MRVCSITSPPSAWNKNNLIFKALDALGDGSDESLVSVIQNEIVGSYHADPEDDTSFLTYTVRSYPDHWGGACFQIILRAFLCEEWAMVNNDPMLSEYNLHSDVLNSLNEETERIWSAGYRESDIPISILDTLIDALGPAKVKPREPPTTQ